MALKRLYFRVYGRVQGIGFRYFVSHEANALGLKGFVRNLPDGSVDGEAEGDEKVLNDFLSRLERNHPYAVVKKIEKHFINDLKQYKGFNIQLW